LNGASFKGWRWSRLNGVSFKGWGEDGRMELVLRDGGGEG